MDRLRRHLKQQNISQTEFARQMGVSQPTVWEWLNGDSLPSARRLRQLSKVTGISIDDLLSAPVPLRRGELQT